MVHKTVQIMCLVSVLFACSESSIIYRFGHPRRPYMDSMEYFRERLQAQKHDYNLNVPSTSTEKQTKEYGSYTIYFNPNNKKDFYVSNELVTWDEARDACKNMGMILASPVTENEQEELKKYILENDLIPKDVFSGYWIGSRRMSTYTPWRWESNNEVVSSFGWLIGEPNGYEGENCMELKQDYSLGWNNYYCGGERRYICEQPSQSLESKKNTVEKTKESVHEEIAKNLKESEPVTEATTENLRFVGEDKIDLHPQDPFVIEEVTVVLDASSHDTNEQESSSAATLLSESLKPEETTSHQGVDDTTPILSDFQALQFPEIPRQRSPHLNPESFEYISSGFNTHNTLDESLPDFDRETFPDYPNDYYVDDTSADI